MNRGLLAEGPGRAKQPGMALIYSRVCRKRVSRMKIERNLPRPPGRPERTIVRKVVINRPFDLRDFGKAIDQRTSKAEVFDTAFQFARCPLRILQRHGGQSLESVRPSGDLFGQKI